MVLQTEFLYADKDQTDRISITLEEYITMNGSIIGALLVSCNCRTKH